MKDVSQQLQGGQCNAEDLCCDPINTQIPGVQGPAGAAGADGTDGVNAFTTLTAGFTMPAEGANVVAAVADSSWMTLGQVLFVQVAGYMQVMALPTALSVTLQNLENTASAIYPGNAAPATAIPNASKVSPGGVTGPAGATPAGALLAANNLSDVAAVATSRTNLGLGTMAVQNAAAVAITGGTIAGITDLAVADGGTGSSTAAAARTALGLAIGTNVQAFDATLQSLSALGTVADRIAYTTALDTWAETPLTATGRSIIDDASVAAVRATLNVLSGYGLLGSITAVDLNVGATDTPITMLSANYIVRRVVVTNASTNLTTATAGVFNTAGGVGTIAADQVLSALTTAALFRDLTLSAPGTTTRQTAAQLFFRVGTPQGAAATSDVYIYGEKLD